MKFSSLHSALTLTEVHLSQLIAEGDRLKSMSHMDRVVEMSKANAIFSGVQSLRKGWVVRADGLAVKHVALGGSRYGYSMPSGSIWLVHDDVKIVV